MKLKQDRPECLRGSTFKLKCGCGSIYVTINEGKDGIPQEVFCRLGKAGGCASSQTEALGRLITLALKGGTSFSDIIDELRGISCHQTLMGKQKILSCADAVAQILVAYGVRTEQKFEPEAAIALDLKVPSDGLPMPLTKQKTPEDIPKFDHEKNMKEVAIIVKREQERASATGACPDCGGLIANQEGCLVCHSCGWSKC